MVLVQLSMEFLRNCRLSLDFFLASDPLRRLGDSIEEEEKRLHMCGCIGMVSFRDYAE